MQGWCSNTPVPPLLSSGFRVRFLYVTQTFLVIVPFVKCPHPGNKLYFSGLGTSYCRYISQTLYVISTRRVCEFNVYILSLQLGKYSVTKLRHVCRQYFGLR